MVNKVCKSDKKYFEKSFFVDKLFEISLKIGAKNA